MSELDQYDYELPQRLIAQQPVQNRVDARLLLVDRAAQSISHHHVRDLPSLLRAGDVLVLNDSRVVPARLVGQRTLTGGYWEGLFLADDDEGNWQVLARTRGRPEPGETVTLVGQTARDSVELRLLVKEPDGVWIVRPQSEQKPLEILERVGRVPLPRYIRDGEMMPSDWERYQTVYAARPGSVAAPTAGLHFTAELLAELESRGVGIARLTLHVGLDTFRPIATVTLNEHAMHSEWGEIGPAAVAAIAAARKRHGRVIAVGTTSTRVLETAAAHGTLAPWQGRTNLFIRPGHAFRAVDALWTNFHLPRTTLLVLARTFGGDELISQAYEQAVREEYRFYSYGDAMLIV